MKNFKRHIEPLIKDHIISADEITILTGSRQVGKTTILKSLQEELDAESYSISYFTLERHEFKRLLDESPENIFAIIPIEENRKQIVFIDEIQYLSNPTNFLKLLYDEHREKLKLVVTGSSAFYIDRKFKDSLAGRKRIFHITPFSFSEMLDSKGENTLKAYINQGIYDKKAVPLLYVDKLVQLAAEYAVYGGYPRVVLAKSSDEKQLVLNELVSSFLKKDALESNIRKETEFMLYTEILADRTGSRLNRQELCNLVGINDETAQNYQYILMKSFHLSLVRPFWKSKTSELRKMSKFYFQDNGMRNAILHDFSALALRKDKEELVENMAYILLRNHYKREEIQYWMTKDQKEVDFIIGKKQAIEVRYSNKLIKPSKYKLFKQTYPEIEFQFGCFIDDSYQHKLICTI